MYAISCKLSYLSKQARKKKQRRSTTTFKEIVNNMKSYQEEKKILVVSRPNTIDDPNTMMIHLKNTPLTYMYGMSKAII
jgi:hypothetical protein